ncbi:carbohydrate kinase family protein [Kitasatospora sp. NPDC004240]
MCEGPGSVRFLVVGECVADIVRGADGVERVHPGGSPANVAYGLARLGRAVTLVTQLGDDAYGRLIRAHLESAGVTVVAEDGGRTPSAVVGLDGRGRARYGFDIAWTLGAAALDEAGPAFAARPHHLHLGSIGAVTEPGAGAVLDLVERLRGAVVVSYDPNVRPALMGEHGPAVGRVEHCVGLSDLVKASDEDLAWLYPGEDPAAVARRWLDLGPSEVIVTRGAGGATAYTADGAVEVPVVPVVVVDTVGAGDSFMAALLAARYERGPFDARTGLGDHAVLTRAMARAATAAALTVSRAGANPPDAAELLAATAAPRPVSGWRVLPP